MDLVYILLGKTSGIGIGTRKPGELHRKSDDKRLSTQVKEF